MHRLSWFLLGAVSLGLVALLAGFMTVRQGHGFSAREQPSAIETWVARLARGVSVSAEVKARANPVPNTQEVLEEARAHWADHCALCHANNGSGESEVGKNMYPPAPDMRLDATQRLTDGELFNIIENGIRMTGMPAWGGSDHDPQDSWKLVRFIRHLPQLTAQEEQQMQKLNPKTPDELREEQEENEFLNGGKSDEKTQHHH